MLLTGLQFVSCTSPPRKPTTHCVNKSNLVSIVSVCKCLWMDVCVCDYLYCPAYQFLAFEQLFHGCFGGHVGRKIPRRGNHLVAAQWGLGGENLAHSAIDLYARQPITPDVFTDTNSSYFDCCFASLVM